MGHPVQMRVATVEFTGGVSTRTLEEAELRISPTYLAQEDLSKLRYRLAAALMFYDQALGRQRKLHFDPAMWAGALTSLGAGVVVYSFSKSQAAGVTVCIGAILIWSVLMTKREMRKVADVPLRAIELTGELEAGLALMRSGRDNQPSWAPPFLQRWARQKTQRRMDYIEAEAHRRGLGKPKAEAPEMARQTGPDQRQNEVPSEH